MRSAVQAATSSWATLHPSLLLRLSGGLDSSIVAGCLGRRPNKSRFAAYTYFSSQRPLRRTAVGAACRTTLALRAHRVSTHSGRNGPARVGLQMGPSLEPSPLLSLSAANHGRTNARRTQPAPLRSSTAKAATRVFAATRSASPCRNICKTMVSRPAFSAWRRRSRCSPKIQLERPDRRAAPPLRQRQHGHAAGTNTQRMPAGQRGTADIVPSQRDVLASVVRRACAACPGTSSGGSAR